MTDQVFPGARVDIEKVGGGWSETVYANDSGYYIASGMPTGTYDVTFKVANDKAYISSGVFSSWLEHTETVSVSGATQCDYDWNYGQGGDRDQSGSAYALTNVFHVRDSWDYYKNTIGTDYADSVEVMAVIIDTVNAEGFTGPWSPFIDMGREFALSSEIMNHEYGHNMVYWFYDEAAIYNGSGTQDPYRDYNESYAMEEGFADMYTTYQTEDHAMGGPYSSAGEPSFRSGYGVTVRLLYNSLTMSDFVDTYASRHSNGRIIGGAMWHLRSSIGVTDAQELAVDAMTMVPRAQSFLGFRINIEAADENANSGANLLDIEDRFFNKEIGAPNAPTSVTVSDLGYATQVTWNDLSGLEDSYELWRKPSGGNWSLRESGISPNTTSTTDDKLTCGDGAHYFKIIVEADGVEAESPEKYFLNCAPKRSFADDALGLSVDVAVVPNPTADPAVIQIVSSRAAEASVIVYDVLGRKVFANENTDLAGGQSDISIRGLSAGTYFYSITAENHFVSGTFFVIR